MIAHFFHTLRRYRSAILFWGLGLAAIGSIVVLVYDTISEKQALIEQFMEGMPPVFAAMAGEAEQYSTPSGWLHIKYFMFLPVMIGFYAVMSGAAILAGDEEQGRLDLIMAYPLSRTRVFFGRLLGLGTATFLILGIAWLGIVGSVTLTPFRLSPLQAMIPFVTLFAVIVFFQALALLMSMLMPSKNISAGAAGLVLIVSFFFEVFSQVQPKLKPLAASLPLHYYQGGLAVENFSWGSLALLLGTATLLVAAAWRLFSKREIRVMGEGSFRKG